MQITHTNINYVSAATVAVTDSSETVIGEGRRG